MTMIDMTIVSLVPSMAAVMPAVVPTMPAAVSATGQDLRDAVAQHKRDEQAKTERSFHWIVSQKCLIGR